MVRADRLEVRQLVEARAQQTLNLALFSDSKLTLRRAMRS
jgi:hypothetical protein